MSDSTTDPVKRRMTRQAGADSAARAFSPARALRLALETSGDRLFALALAVGTLEQRCIPHAALAQEAGTGDLLLLLDGADGARAAAVIEPPLVRALIEVQTTGRVRAQAQATGPRPFTDTDAAMIAPLVEAVLAGLDRALGDAHPRHRPTGFRYGGRVADGRGLALALDAPTLEVFRITADIAGGAATGAVTFALPPGLTAAPPEPAGGRDGARQVLLAPAAMRAPARLDVVLARVRLSLSEAGALRPGMTLPVGIEALGRAELLAPGGQVIARARLGRVNGYRAVRLCPTDEPPAEPDGARAALPGPAAPAGSAARKVRTEPPAPVVGGAEPGPPATPQMPELAPAE